MVSSEKAQEADAVQFFARSPELFTPDAAMGELNDEYTDVFNSFVSGGIELCLTLLAALDISRCDDFQLGWLSAGIFEEMFNAYGDDHITALLAAIDEVDPGGRIRCLTGPTHLSPSAKAKFQAWAGPR